MRRPPSHAALDFWSDVAAVTKTYRLSLHSAALRHLDRDRPFSALLVAAADEAERIAADADERVDAEVQRILSGEV